VKTISGEIKTSL